MSKRNLLAFILIAFFVGAIGSIAIGRFFIPYLANATGWESLNKLVTNSPIVINRTNEVFLNEGVNLIDLTKQAGNITVTLFTNETNPSFLGNGIIMTSDGLIFTSKNLIQGKTEVTAVLNNGNSYKALVRAVDPKSDIAALTIDEKSLSVPSFADGFGLSTGQRVLAIGYSNRAFERKLAQGYVTNTAMNNKIHLARTYTTEVLEDSFQTDAEVNTGEFDGSPIINLNGRLVGMVVGHSIQKIAIAENLQSALSSYLSSGKIVRPRLGLSYFQLSRSVASLKKLDRAGALVSKIDAGSPAAGKILVNDLIFEVDGRSIENESFEQVINRHSVGEIKFKLLRVGNEVEVTINLIPTT
jgi:serine protease Do